MFTLIVLDCVTKLKEERSASAIYHLVTGKRSSQTLQDAHNYQLTDYFGILKNLNRESFNDKINNLKKDKFLELDSSGIASVTVSGNDYMNKYMVATDTPFKGLKYDRIHTIFLKRLQLFIQTITNISSENPSFIAITDDVPIQQWVKKLYKQNRDNLRIWIDGIYQELNDFLNKLDDMDASIFVDRLTGYKKVGLSKEQLAKKHEISVLDVELVIVKITHMLISYLIANRESSPFLFEFTNNLFNHMFITDSTAKTYRLMNKGFSIPTIAKMRQLKESTIQDHIVEIAYIDDHFNIEAYVNKNDVLEIVNVTNRLKTNKLKLIKTKLNNKYSYFQIRLVLAKARGGEGEVFIGKYTGE